MPAGWDQRRPRTVLPAWSRRVPHRGPGAASLLAVLVLVACTSGPGVQARSTAPSAPSTTAPVTGPVTGPVTPDVTAGSGSTPTSAVTGTLPSTVAGHQGVGDRLFPDLGNPGVDVDRYDVDLAYDRRSEMLSGSVTLHLHFTDARSWFTLDCDGPRVSAVTIDGFAVPFRSAVPELVIALPAPATAGQEAVVKVSYSLQPEPIDSPGGLTAGWYPTSGGSYVLNEPDGARSWLPSNDHPSDKAEYRFRITVPAGVTAVANGNLVAHTTTAGLDTWSWEEAHPMATYLISVITGHYDLVAAKGPHGLPLLSAVLTSDRAVMQPFLDVTGEQIAYFESLFGPYPFDRYGVSIVDSPSGQAMETQERSLFSRDDFKSGKLQYLQQLLLSHELAHQWFGDAVTPATWGDIWLNESFATYAQWLWLDHADVATTDNSAAVALAGRRSGSTASPSADELFGYNSYDGGAVVLHALRRTIGDASFFELLRTWVQSNLGQVRTTADFVRLAQQVSGRDLTEFFQTWLYATTLPNTYP